MHRFGLPVALACTALGCGPIIVLDSDTDDVAVGAGSGRASDTDGAGRDDRGGQDDRGGRADRGDQDDQDDEDGRDDRELDDSTTGAGDPSTGAVTTLMTTGTVSTSGPLSTGTVSTGTIDVDVECPSLVDDFDHGGSPFLPPVDGRFGRWYIYNDGSETGQQPPFVVIDGEGFSGTNAALAAGAGFTIWGAGIGVPLNNPDVVDDDLNNRPYDLSMFSGLRFQARSEVGPLALKVKLPTRLETPIDEGGSCDSELDFCGDAYLSAVTLEGRWQTHEVRFDLLTQEGFGLAVPFDATQVLQLQFQVAASVDFVFFVDNICLF